MAVGRAGASVQCSCRAGAHGGPRRGLLETVSHVTKQSHLCSIGCISDVIRRERGGPRCSVSRHVTAQARELGLRVQYP